MLLYPLQPNQSFKAKAKVGRLDANNLPISNSLNLMDYLKDNGKWIALHTATWSIAKALFVAIKLWGIDDTGLEVNNTTFLLFVVAFTGLIDGFVFGLIDSEFDKVFKSLPFTRRVVAKTSVNLAVGLSLTVIMIPLLLDWTPLRRVSWFADTLEVTSLVIMGLYIFLITLGLQVAKSAALWIQTHDVFQILSDRQSGVEEDRIFMFLDMKSSTSHAEKLGAKNFSLMIQDCFYDMTTAARENHAEIYQYIGDEAVFTWLASSDNFLRSVNLYFSFREIISGRSTHYRSRYGFVPQFKAGVHHGRVIKTHVGVVRKSIAFHGDVVNTTSRIQAKCNDLGCELLASSEVVQRLPCNLDANHQGRYFLRGKEDEVNLYSLSKRG